MSTYCPDYIGYLNGVPQRRVYLRITLRNHTLSISGEAADGSAGQINMHIQPSDITPAKHLTGADIEQLWAIWDRWHLNHMNAGCEHQNSHARARGLSPDKCWSVGESCPVCYYRYGYEWIREQLPESVIAWLRNHFTVIEEN